VSIQRKSFALGVGFVCLLFVGAIAVFLASFTYSSRQAQPPFREHTLPSGKSVKITAFHLLWGVEHDERRSHDDTFGLEYASAAAQGDLAVLDREIAEVFELIRPISEQWGLTVATIAAFPTTKRQGRYYIYTFTREPQGQWTFERKPAKVFIND
jgi:hypothetical protein